MDKKIGGAILVFLLCFFTSQLLAQQAIAVGAWQSHFNYNVGIDVEQIDDDLFYACQNTIIRYNSHSQELRRMGKVEGFSDVGIACIKASQETKTLVIAYTNSNIDLYHNGKVTNISELKNKELTGNKSINNIFCQGQTAYLVCGFGIVLIDLYRGIVKDTWFINNGYGMDLTICQDSLFLVSTTGIFKTPLSNPFPSNFASWEQENQIATPNLNGFSNIVSIGDSLYLLKEDSIGAGTAQYLYHYDHHQWKKDDRFDWSWYLNFDVKNDLLIIGTGWMTKVYQMTAQGLQVFAEQYIDYPTGGVCDENSNLYLSTKSNGLFHCLWGNPKKIDISSPAQDAVASMVWKNGKLFACHGGHNDWLQLWNIGTASVLSNGSWRILNNNTADGIPYDLIDVDISSSDSNVMYAASYCSGLIEYTNGDEISNLYNSYNSPLRPPESISDSGETRVCAITLDNKNNVWLINSLTRTSKPLLVKTKEGQWQSYAIPYTGTSLSGNLLFDSRELLWITYDRDKSLFLFKSNGTPLNSADDQWAKLNTTITSENGSFTYIYSIVEDKNGRVWLGTDNGLKVYRNPSSLLSNPSTTPSSIAVERVTGGDTLVELVLSSEKITSICVDGGDRKWIGTDGGGAFLLSEDATEQLLHFDTENSPLPSNTINSIAIDGESGEVYFGTSKGTLSFRYTATEGNEDQSKLKIFPNPVKPNYDGYITIEGLVEESEVKITDNTGRLVYRTTSNGGTAVWDGRKFDGTKVATGVYYVLVSGGKKMKLKNAGKIIFIK